MRVVLFANSEWYLFNFRRSLAIALQQAGHEVILLSPPGPYGPKLQDLGLRWESIPMLRGSLNPFREALVLLRLICSLKRLNPDLLHCFTIKCAIYGSAAARVCGMAARVNAVAGMGYVFISNDLRARLLRPLVTLFFRTLLGGKSARLILQNSDDVRLFENLSIVAPRSIRLIRGSGVDCSQFAPREFHESRDGQFRVLFVGRLLYDKGLGEFVEAARILKCQGRDIHFLIAGETDPGNPAAVSANKLRAWKREGFVSFLGHVADMPALLQTVDVVALPSYREGLPKSLIEAASCGIPLVTTDVPGCREVVTNEVTGLLVAVRDADALAQAVAKLHDDPHLAMRLGRAARDMAVEVFNEARVIGQTIAVYNEVLPD